MAGLLEGKTAVITGAASGNGRAIALAFAREGAAVVVADIRQDPREGGVPTHQLLQEQGSRSVFVPCDVTHLDQLEMAMQAALPLGGLDILVNNAGILTKQSVLEATEADFERMMNINVKSIYFATQAA